MGMDNVKTPGRKYVWVSIIAVGVLVGGSAIVFAAVPHSFVSGETLTADNLNGNFSALEQRLSALENMVPAGAIVAFGGPSNAGSSSVPGGWLLCDGSTVSRTTYANLFAAIGINYGGGDGVNSFNL